MTHSIFWGGQPLMQGSEYSLPDQIGREIVRAGKAVQVKDDSTIDQQEIVLDTETASPVIETVNEPQRKRGRRAVK